MKEIQLQFLSPSRPSLGSPSKKFNQNPKKTLPSKPNTREYNPSMLNLPSRLQAKKNERKGKEKLG